MSSTGTTITAPTAAPTPITLNDDATLLAAVNGLQTQVYDLTVAVSALQTATTTAAAPTVPTIKAGDVLNQLQVEKQSIALQLAGASDPVISPSEAFGMQLSSQVNAILIAAMTAYVAANPTA